MCCGCIRCDTHVGARCPPAKRPMRRLRMYVRAVIAGNKGVGGRMWVRHATGGEGLALSISDPRRNKPRAAPLPPTPQSHVHSERACTSRCQLYALRAQTCTPTGLRDVIPDSVEVCAVGIFAERTVLPRMCRLALGHRIETQFRFFSFLFRLWSARMQHRKRNCAAVVNSEDIDLITKRKGCSKARHMSPHPGFTCADSPFCYSALRSLSQSLAPPSCASVRFRDMLHGRWSPLLRKIAATQQPTPLRDVP